MAAMQIDITARGVLADRALVSQDVLTVSTASVDRAIRQARLQPERSTAPRAIQLKRVIVRRRGSRVHVHPPVIAEETTTNQAAQATEAMTFSAPTRRTA